MTAQEILAVSEPPNIPEIAGYYSQLAGVLAGFSFAGLIALVTARLGTEPRRSSIWYSVAPLTSAFIALVASSLNYALVAGELPGTPRVASLQAIAGMGFSIAGVMLVYSIFVLLSDLRHEAGTAAINLLRNMTVLILPPLLVLLMWGSVRDHLGRKYEPGIGFVEADWIALGTLLVTVVFTVWVRLTLRSRLGDQAGAVPRLASFAAQLAFLSLIGSSTLITLTTGGTVIPDAIPLSAMLLVAAFSLATAYSAGRYHPSGEEVPRPTPEQPVPEEVPRPTPEQPVPEEDPVATEQVPANATALAVRRRPNS